MINVYCDESCHLEHDKIPVMLIGCVWCDINEKDRAFKNLRSLKVKHGMKPYWELKWNAVSKQKLAYYLDVLDYFFSCQDLHFRVLVVPDKSKLQHERYGQTHDSFYYKMYFDMLKTILSPQNEYNIYMDIKDTRGTEKIRRLEDVLCNNAYDFDHKMIKRIQHVKSHEVELVELADFLIGAVGYLNRNLKSCEAKLQIIERIKELSHYSLTKSTLVKEDKFNIFIWKERTYGSNIR